MERKDSRGRILRKGEYQRKDGTYEYHYTDDQTGARRWAYAKTLRELRKKEESLKDDVKSGVTRTGRTTSLDEAFDEWVSKRREDVNAGLLRKHTLENYQYLWNTMVRGTKLGKCKVAKLTTELIQEHYKHMLGNGLTIGTVETVHTPISQVAKYAYAKGWCKRDVSHGACTSISRAARKSDEAEGKYDHAKCLEREEKAALLEELKDSRWRHYAPIIRLLLHTGMRAGELCGLTFEDLGDKSIWIRRSLGYKHDEYGHMHYVDGPPKTPRSRREILLTNDAKVDLREWLDLGERCKRPPCGLEDLVFCKPRHSAMNYSAMNKILHEVARSANAKAGYTVIPEKLTCHWLRHTFITDTIDAGVPAHVVSQYVGHESIDITMHVYYTCRRSTVEEAIDILNRASDNGTTGLTLLGGASDAKPSTK